MLTILIASQSAAIRAGIRSLLGADPEFQFLEDRIDAVRPFSHDEKEAILIFHEEDWVWLKSVVEVPQDILVIGDQVKSLLQLNTVGGRGWGALSIRASAEALRAALLAVHQGLFVLPPQFLEAMKGNGAGNNEELSRGPELIDPLSEREIEVLQLLTQGLQNKQIARTLNISENTIKFHVSSIYSKLGVSNRAEAVRRGAQLGLIAL